MSSIPTDRQSPTAWITESDQGAAAWPRATVVPAEASRPARRVAGVHSESAQRARMIAQTLRAVGYGVVSGGCADDASCEGQPVVAGQAPSATTLWFAGGEAQLWVVDVPGSTYFGLQLIRELRRRDTSASVVFVASDPSTHTEAYLHGATVVLDAPLDTRQLARFAALLGRLPGPP